MVSGDFLVNTTTGTVPDLTPITDLISSFFTILSTLLGGLFGLYFIFLLLRFFYDRKILKEVRALKHEVHELRKKLRKK